jgi:hypothetical protein
VFFADGDPEDGPLHLSFKLSAEQGMIALFAANLSLIDCVFYEPQTPDVSEGRQPSGGGVFGRFPTPTPGAGNPAVPPPNGEFILVVNEVQANNASLTNADGTITDWVELLSGSPTPLDLSDMSLTDTAGTPRRWVFPAGVTLLPGARLVVLFNPDAPASSNNVAPLNAGFGLGANGDAVYLFDAPSRGSALLDSVVFGLQPSDYSIGRVPNGTGAWQLCVPTRGSGNIAASLGSVSPLRINEWLADPRSGDDDWFELFNPQAQPVSLGGLFLTDEPGDRTLSPIPALSFIGTSSNAFVRFIADSEPSRGADHVDFKLSKDADFIVLYPPGNGPAIDLVSFGPQVNRVSQGRFPDGSANIISFPGTESPGEPNFLPLLHIVISEALTHTDLPFEDAIELRNLSSEAVDIGGWFLSDSDNDLRKYRIPNGTVVPAGGFKVFYEYQFNPEPGHGQSFSLSSARGDEIHLSTADAGGALTGYRASVKFDAAFNGTSFGRFETSTGPDFPPLLARSFGLEGAGVPPSVEVFRTGLGASNAAPIIGPVVIHEIHYHPPSPDTNDNVLDEFIELRNVSGVTVPLYDVAFPSNRWRLRDAVDFDFPSQVSLAAAPAPESYLLVVNFNPTNTTQLDAFRSKFNVPVGVQVFGPYGGKLDNGSDSVELYRPDAPQMAPAPDAGFVPYVLADRVRYSDTAPWASLADGNLNGYSLQRLVAGAYGNDPVNWVAGLPTAGRANGAPVVPVPSILTPPLDVFAPESGSATFSVVATGSGPLGFQWRFNGQPIAGAVGTSLVLTNLLPAQEGRYAVLVSNPAGAVSSAEVRLSLQSPPVITAQPVSRIVLAGASASFSVAAIGSGPLAYEWRRNAVALPGQSGPTLSLNNIQAANEGAYTVVITNIYGAVTSQVAQLTINAPPSITTPPQNLVVNAGDTAMFSVGVSGSAPLRFQWRYNGADIPAETNGSLTLNNVQGSSAAVTVCG